MIFNIDSWYVLARLIIISFMKWIVAVCIVAVAVGFHLESAKVIEKVGDAVKKRTKFGDVYLHREHSDGEEV